jgi:CheY-like chemotaxis protein
MKLCYLSISIVGYYSVYSRKPVTVKTRTNIYMFTSYLSNNVKILIAEDEADVLDLYKGALERNGHSVILALNGEEALKVYQSSIGEHDSKAGRTNDSPFDVVVLDYKMPKKNGMEVAKSIFALNPRQRIIFASAFVKDTLVESVRKLDQIVELIQKPFELKTLVDTIEDTGIYAKLQEFNVNVPKIKSLGLGHEQLMDLMVRVSEIMKQKFVQ